MKEQIKGYLLYLIAERGLAENTVISYESDLLLLKEYLESKKKDFTCITKLDIIKYFEFEAGKRQIEASSQMRKCSVFFNFLKFLEEEKVISSNVMSELDRPSKNETLPIFLDEEETEKLLRAARSEKTRGGIRNYAILELLYSSGMRISECLGLKLDDVCNGGKIKHNVIILGKGAKERLIFINEDSGNALLKYLEIRGFFGCGRYLFCSNAKEGHLTRQNFYYSLKKIAYKAGVELEKVSPHKIRHSFATHMFLNGIDLRILQDMLGHADISSTQIYTHINDEKLRQTVDQFHPLSKKL